MAGQNRLIARDLERVLGPGVLPAGDGELLQRFVDRRDEAAIESLILRHGPMVRGVCGRLLADRNDVDDAFQATFLVLVLRAAKIRDAERLGPWLYGVATRVALKVRSRRGRHLTLVGDIPAPPSTEDLADMRPIFDAELGKLAPRFREVLVLCLLEETTVEEAARRLSCPLGTVKSRLARGRKALQSRLTARGVAPGLAAAAVSSVSASPVSAALVRTTVANVTAAKAAPALLLLTRGVLSAMTVRLIVLTACVLGGVSLAGLGTARLLRAHDQPPKAAEAPPPAPKIVVARVEKRVATIRQTYTCRLEAHHHIEVRVPESGFLEVVPIREGKLVKRDDELFRNRSWQGAIKVVRAPFDGLIGQIMYQEGSMVREGETVTRLSDPAIMWAYFNVPESRFLEYMATSDEEKKAQKVSLVLANGETFPEPGRIESIASRFNAETGNIPFRADFPNPDRLLRDGQTGTVQISHEEKGVIVIPQRATFEVADKRFVFLVGGDRVARRREIVVRQELDDVFALKRGLDGGERIVVEGVPLVHDGDKVGP